jgi:hypothetical protein
MSRKKSSYCRYFLVASLILLSMVIFPVNGATDTGQPPAAHGGAWQIETAAPSWEAPVPENPPDGRAISLILDQKDIAHLGYYNATEGEIRYATRRNGTWADEHVGSSAGTFSVSIAVDPTGNPSVTYGDGFHFGNLIHAEKAGTSWTVTRVDRGSAGGIEDSVLGNAGHYSSLVIDDQGDPHVSYNDGREFSNLNYAVRRNGSWTTSVVYRGINGRLLGNTGFDSSLKPDASGNPRIAFRDGNYYGSLMFAEKDGTGWRVTKIDQGWKWDNETLPDPWGNTGWFPSLALDSDGDPVIAYYDANEKSLMNAQRMWPRTEFVTWPVGLPASVAANDTGRFVTLAIDRRDHRHMAFCTAPAGSLYYTFLDGKSIRFSRVGSGSAGRYASLALDSSGIPHIAYYDAAGKAIRYASPAR